MPKRDNTSRVKLKFVQQNRVRENNSELRSFDAVLEDGSGSEGVTGGYAVKSRDREKVRRESFRRGKLSATRYYGHAVGIAELYGGYFFFSSSFVHFSGETVGEIAIFKVLQNLVTTDRYKVRSLISDIDPTEAWKMNERQGTRSSTIAI